MSVEKLESVTKVHGGDAGTKQGGITRDLVLASYKFVGSSDEVFL